MLAEENRWSALRNAIARRYSGSSAQAWTRLPVANLLEQDRQRGNGSVWQRSGLLWQAISAGGDCKERCRVYFVPAKRRRVPETQFATEGALNAYQRGNASLVATVLGGYS